MSADQPVTVNILRTVRSGREDDFETLVREFIPTSLTFPGHLGVHIVKPAAGTSRDYHIVIKFAAREQWQNFQASPEYARFRTAIEPLLEREPCIEEMTGLESWFTLPHAQVLRPLPRWKMALVTLLGVYPTSLLVGVFISSRLTHWPGWLKGLAFAVCMVAILTWGVMPLLTRLLARWLYSQAPATDRKPKERIP
ncbi:MAG: antibiotic biosynthesis monooxygenase [Planctomycetota bacterium]